MNPDPRFEAKLRELIRNSPLPDPTPRWRSEILGHALVPHRLAGPPRALLAVWGIAWIGILALSWPTAAPPSPMPGEVASAGPAPLLFAQRAEFLKQLDLP